jgi:2-keto-4-pentenoate hydratase/2-oxohepta-3-ene-1,7-dioic acid hydratase in catechol pathway
MRVCSYIDASDRGTPDQLPRHGTVEGDTVRPLGHGGLQALLGGRTPPHPGEPVPLLSVVLQAPLRPGKLIGVGLNYREHARETGQKLPERPLLFAKFPSAMTAPGGPIRMPAYTSELDYEGELAVVIGTLAHRVPVAEALSHVFGYAVMDDVSARDLQRAEPQWVLAKSGDTFAPWGPWITTADEIADPQDLTIQTWINGELRQNGSTSDMVFSVAELIAYISARITLEPGDVITTGTPSGVGVGFDPKRFLAVGDQVRISIDGLGTIEHGVVES